jgi:LPS-assembly lipoprotein
MKRIALLLLPLAPALACCGLQPVYSGGSSGAVASTLRSVEVGPIDGRAGWLVRTNLEERLGGPKPSGSSRYRLQVRLDDAIVGFGLRSDDAETRERRTLRARYQLVETDKGTIVLDATAASDAGIDIVTSDYATVAAEQTALERLSREIADQIVARVALYAKHGGKAP